MTSAVPILDPNALPASRTAGVVRDLRVNSFDLVRLLAATSVLVAHSAPLRGHAEASFFGYDNVSKVAVYVFFAISGYLITQSWVSDPHVLRFSTRRALRIFPALVCVVLLSVFVLGPLLTKLPLSEYFAARGTWDYLRNIAFSARYPLPGVFTTNLGNTAVNGSLWTLPLEVKMYVGVLVLGRLRLLTWWSSLLIAVGLALSALHLTPSNSHYALCDLGVYFWAGSFLFLARSRLPLRRDVAAGLLGIGAVCAFTPMFHVAAWLAIPYLVLLVSLAKLPGASLVHRYGDFSYGMYIYAFPVQQLVVWRWGATLSNAVNLALVLVFTLVLAMASWHWVERPALKLKPRRAGSRASRASVGGEVVIPPA